VPLRRAVPAVGCFLWLVTLGAGEASAAVRPLQGLAVTEAISRLALDGLQVVYSSEVVGPGLVVRTEPVATGSRARLEEILAPHGLVLREMASGRLVVVRRGPAVSAAADAPAGVRQTAVDAPGGDPLQTIVVTGSRFHLDRLADSNAFVLFAAELERMPDLGDDPLRAVARLPGAASGGFSAKSNIRGGDAEETLVRFDGFRLHNPFHLKDFQSVFSTIDPALVDSIDVHTGGYPVEFGDRMSGVIDIESLDPPAERIASASLSLLSAGMLLADSSDDGDVDWLLSGRRGNLDLLIDAIDPRRGRPRYFDLHARVGRRVSDNLALRGSALYFDDDIEISDTDQEEQATARYRDTYFWLGVDWTPRDGLVSRSQVGVAELVSDRHGSADQPGVAAGQLDDRRNTQLLTIDSHWQWQPAPEWRFDAGGEYRRSRGHYRYQDAVEFDLLFATEGAPSEVVRVRDETLRVSGDHVAAYVAAQYAFTSDLAADLGLRYDFDTLPGDDEGTFSPRAGLAWRATERLDLKLAWGRFAQSQTAMETQIADGITEYFPAQRADHLLLGLRYRTDAGASWRVDAYDKRYRSLRPRFENLLNAAVILPELKPDRVLVDADEATARGIELTLQSGANRPLNWWANYSWSQVRDRIGDEDLPRNWDQTHAFGAGIGWRDERWDLTAALSWRSGWPTTPVELATLEPVAIAEVGERNSRRLGAYLALDLRAARRFAFDDSVLTVFLEVTNATNRENPCCVDYEIDSEDIEPFLELDTEPYLPTLPNLGFVWEF